MALTFEEYIAEKKRQGFITPPSIEEVYNELRARIETVIFQWPRKCAEKVQSSFIKSKERQDDYHR